MIPKFKKFISCGQKKRKPIAYGQSIEAKQEDIICEYAGWLFADILSEKTNRLEIFLISTVFFLIPTFISSISLSP